MVAKRAISTKVAGGGNYFSTPKKDVAFISSGCLMLDLVLGGGWAERKICNIVGDKSTGKTLLAIEAAANFARKYTKGEILYRECEAAFSPEYAEALGMPMDRVDFGDGLETVEDLFEDVQDVIKNAKSPVLYIVDSLDALSDRAEMAREMDAGTYGVNKARNLSQMFRRIVRGLSSSNVTMMIVSQVRSKIGLSFGRGTTRSGGRALDFYASQVLYLSSGELEKRTIGGVTRPTGIKVKGRVDKNKVGLSYREAEFSIVFGYGINDFAASLEWLRKVGGLSDIGLSKSTKVSDIRRQSKKYIYGGSPGVDLDELSATVKSRWYELEGKFLPRRRKHED